MGRRHSYEIDVDLEDFDDDEIIDEVRLRGIEEKVRIVPPAPNEKPLKPQEVAAEVQSWLITRHYDKAEIAMQKLISAFVPPSVAAAYAAMRDGRIQDAICEIDDFIEPPKSATTKTLPIKQEQKKEMPT
jgi:hypothetical protein